MPGVVSASSTHQGGIFWPGNEPILNPTFTIPEAKMGLNV